MTVVNYTEIEGGYRMTLRRGGTSINERLRQDAPSLASKMVQAAMSGGQKLIASARAIAEDTKPVAQHALGYFPNGVISFSGSPAAVKPELILGSAQPEKLTPAASLKNWFHTKPRECVLNTGLLVGAACLLAGGCQKIFENEAVQGIGSSIEEVMAPAFDAEEVYETPYTRTTGIENAAEDDMRERLEGAIQSYTEDFVANARSGNLSNSQRCIDFNNTQYVSAVRAQPIQVQEPKRLRIVILDPGHARETEMGKNGYDTGAYAEVGDHTYEEAMIVGRIGTELARQLEDEGVMVVNVRDETRNGLSLSGLDTRLSLAWRSGLATHLAVQFPEAEFVYMNIHADSLGEEKRNQTVYAYAPSRGGTSDSPNSVMLAEEVASRYRLSPFSQMATADTKSIAALRCNSASIPAVLVETGNLQNASDQVQFSKVIYGNEGKTEELAGMLTQGIMAYYQRVTPHLEGDDTYSMTVRARTNLPRGELEYREAPGVS